MDKNKVAQELVKLAKALTSATEIKPSELPVKCQKGIKKYFGSSVKIEAAWDGIHGIVVSLDNTERLKAGDLKKLAGWDKFRWLETGMVSKLMVGLESISQWG